MIKIMIVVVTVTLTVPVIMIVPADVTVRKMMKMIVLHSLLAHRGLGATFHFAGVAQTAGRRIAGSVIN